MELSFLLLGVLIGVIVTTILQRTFTYGTIRCDHSDPDSPPYLFLELSTSLHTLIRKKYVTLRVQVKDFISQD